MLFLLDLQRIIFVEHLIVYHIVQLIVRMCSTKNYLDVIISEIVL